MRTPEKPLRERMIGLEVIYRAGTKNEIRGHISFVTEAGVASIQDTSDRFITSAHLNDLLVTPASVTAFIESGRQEARRIIQEAWDNA